MYEGMGKAIDSMFTMIALLLFIAVPLAAWKVIDVIIWICSHVQVKWN